LIGAFARKEGMICLRRIVCLFALLCAVAVAGDANAGIVERAKSEGLVRCGGATRPGLAEPDSSARGAWRGLNVEICRAIAVAVLGPDGRFEFHGYEAPRDYDADRGGTDEVFFLTASEIVAQNLSAKLIPGPAVYYATHAVMVREESAARRVEDLTGARICFVIGSGAQRSVESFFEAKQLPFLRAAFSEEDEMRDAYIAGRCDAVADELTALAKLRLTEGAKTSRILPQPFAVFPVMVFTNAADGKWAAVVAWTIHTLMRADVRERSWRADGARALPIDGTDLELAQGWQERVIDTLGSYAEIYSRTLGDKSVYGLGRGLNASSIEGGLFVAPYSE
jgi:general L-amino acid transport system substrate-binding protein